MSVRREVLSRHCPLLVEGDRLWAGRGLDLFVSEDAGRSFTRVAGVPASSARRFVASLPLAARTARLGFQALRRLPNGNMVGVIRGAIVRGEMQRGVLEPVFQAQRGSRPLDLCVDGSGRVYFGEYFSNPDREKVRVFGSEDGSRWSPVHTFPAGRIRHVHGLVHDPYRDGLWVLTGDEDHESCLWFTADRFDTLEPVVSGTQDVRAVSVIPTEKGLIVPTDSPRIENSIQFLELPEARLNPLCPLPGSAFHALETAGLYLVSTVAEPSPVNHETGATLFASLDGENWRQIDRFPPDVLCRILPFARSVLRYPEIGLAPGDNDTPFVFGFGRSIRNADGRLVRWSRSEIRDVLTDADHPVG